MSFCCCVRNDNGFVMAADSRSTQFDGTAASRIVGFSDACPKIVYIPEAHMAFTAAGQNVFGGIPFSALVRNMACDLMQMSIQDALVAVRDRMKELGVHSNVSLCAAHASGTAVSSWYVDFDADTSFAPCENSGIWRTGATIDVFRLLFMQSDGTNDTCLLNFGEMSLQGMSDFVETLTGIYRDVYRFRKDVFPYIGGPVQLIAVDSLGNVVRNTTIR